MPTRPRFAVVTGGASGLGRAICLELAQEQWTIAVADLNVDGAAQTVDLIQKAGGQGLVRRLDVTDVDQWQALHDDLRAIWPTLDLLVNNAGVAGAGLMGDYAIEDWHWLINVNLWNAVYGCHVFVPWLKTNPHGSHIINTASMAGIACPPGMAAYNVSKSAVIGLSETLSSELRKDNVGVTVVCPEFFATNLLKTSRFTDEKSLRWAQKAFEKSPFTAKDVAQAALDAMKRKQLYVILPKAARYRWYMKRLRPTWFLGKVATLFEKAAASAQQS